MAQKKRAPAKRPEAFKTEFRKYDGQVLFFGERDFFAMFPKEKEGLIPTIAMTQLVEKFSGKLGGALAGGLKFKAHPLNPMKYNYPEL